MQVLGRDVFYALRQLRKTPAFTLTALLTLALGIGVNAAMFSVIDQALLRRVPYPDSSRLMQLGPYPEKGNGFGSASLPDIRDWQQRSHTFSAIAYFTEQLPTLGGTSNPILSVQVTSSANLFNVLGLHAAMGRTFVPDDEKPGRGKILVLSWNLWKQIYHGDPNILGQAVPVNGIKYAVIGILPQGVDFPENTGGMFSPIERGNKDESERDSGVFNAIGRLRAGVTPAQAQTELQQIHQQLLKDYPDKEFSDPIRIIPYQDIVTRDSRPTILALGAAVLAVWLIACANVAGLMLTRTNSRRREIAIRGALGAPRARLIQQFLTESLLLSIGGGLLGLAIAEASIKMLSRYLGSVRNGGDVHIDLTVCLYLLLASCVSALLFGILPAWSAARIPAQEGLREGSAAAGTSKQQVFWRDALVVGEIALTLALLIAGGLMIRTLWELRHTHLGFAPKNLITTTMFLPQTTGKLWWQNNDATQPNLITTFFNPLHDKLRSTPGIEMAAFSTKRSFDTSFHGTLSIHMKGQPKPPKGQEPTASLEAVSDDYFLTVGIPLLRGRSFNSGDRVGTQPVALINQAFANQILTGKNPIGMQIDMQDDDDKGKKNAKDPSPTIIGIVADSRQDKISDAIQPEAYLDMEQSAPGDDGMYAILIGFHMDLVVRTQLAPAEAINIITKDIHSFQPEMALQDTKSMQQVIDDSLSNQTLAARLLSIFGIAALVIAAAGIYGLLSYSVSQRTRELGLRLALGAQRKDVLWLVLRRACILLGIGIAIGACVAWAMGGVLRSFLYGLHAYDAVTVLCVAVLLGLCGLAASYLPAHRAASVDPMEALRSE
jgi:predicted permease